jgi:eukaryotic-like serine/threonine-protein kinase
MIGTEIGHYRIVEKIGEGGMGVVYKAIETQLDRTVAIKALSPELSGNPELVERFRSEARAQAQMNHPNVATLYTFLVEKGGAYMVMEFVEGEGFDRMVQRRGPIPAAEALPLFRQALSGIAYAHRLGIIHRDIKPSNIMLSREGTVKVMDFGLAKVMGDRSLTATGVRLGTIYYMSPEQILNKPADVRSDIYSLGATLYEILTAKVPFQGDSEFHVLNAHVNSPPPLLSGACPTIPERIEQAVLKSLAKNPSERFQTVEAFAAALDQPLDSVSSFSVTSDVGGPLNRSAAPTEVVTTMTAHPPQVQVASVVPTKRNSTIAAVGVGVLAILIAGWLFLRPKAQTSGTLSPAVSVPVQIAKPAESAPPTAVPTSTPAPPAVEAVVVPAGTIVKVHTLDPVDAKNSRVGQEFAAKLAAPVMVGDHAAFQAQDEARLRLQESATVGRAKKGDTVLQLVSVTAAGHTYLVTSTPYLIKGGFLRKKRVGQGTLIQFTLSVPVTLQGQP